MTAPYAGGVLLGTSYRQVAPGPPEHQERKRTLSPALGGDVLNRAMPPAAVALAALTVGLLLVFDRGRTLRELHWVPLTVQAFVLPATLGVAWLAHGRFRTLGGPWAYWTAVTCVAHAVLGAFYLLAWPGLVGPHGVIASLSNTASWLFVMMYSTLLLLVVAVAVRLPAPRRRRSTRLGYAASAALAIAVGLVSVSNEAALPTVVFDGAFTRAALV